VITHIMLLTRSTLAVADPTILQDLGITAREHSSPAPAA
jgi:hypothetical protein